MTSYNISPGLASARAQARALACLAPGTALSHHVIALRPANHLDPAALATALGTVGTLHPALRCRVPDPSGDPVVTGFGPTPVLSDKPISDLVDLVHSLAARPFDLATEPPLRVHLAASTDGDPLLVLVFHRIAVDPPSADRVVEDLIRAWAGTSDSATSTNSDTGAGSTQAESPSIPLIPIHAPELPLDRPRSALSTSNAVSAPLTLPADLLGRLARRFRTDEHTVVLALFATVLYRYDSSGTIGFVVPVPGPSAKVGCFERLVSTAAKVGPDAVFADIVAAVSQAADSARGMDSTMLPDRALPVMRWHQTGEARLLPLPTRTTAADLTVDAREMPDGGATCEIVVAADVFTAETAVRIGGHLERVLTVVAAEPDLPVRLLPLLTPAEEDAFAAPAGEDPHEPSRPFHRQFARQAALTPDAVAVRAEDGVLTYAALDRAANRLAHLLRGLSVGPETAVGLCMDRGIWLAIAVLGVLKAGGVYVPLAPDDPEERRNRVVADAHARVVLAGRPMRVPGAHVVDLIAAAAELERFPGDDPPPCADPAAEPSSAAYILYTSGSTGEPKGVVVEHRQLAVYVDGIIARYGVDRPMRFAMVQPLVVDSSVTAFFPPLCTGGEVHPLSRATALDPDRLADWVAEHGVDCLKIAPSHLRSLQASPRFAELLPARLLVVGGEASDWRWLRDLQRSVPHCRVYNHYGPTETTVGVLTLAVADHPDAEWDVAPIGRPLPGVRVAIVDRNGQEVPVGVVGELMVRGATVARGYHERPDLTAAAFGPDGDRYATGDLARRLADGNIVFVGRRDDQIKVRGFRVELGEIDAALRGHSDVRAAVTVVREDIPGDRAVVSYIESTRRTAPAVDELLRHLRTLLPQHLVPRAVVVLRRLPLSPHGKVDRSALPPPAVSTATDATLVTDMERVVARAWQQVLDNRPVGAEVNFFDVGGHSLLLVELQQHLRATLNREVELLDLLTHTTVREQAQLLAGAPEAARTEHERLPSPQQTALRRRMRQRRANGGRHG